MLQFINLCQSTICQRERLAEATMVHLLTMLPHTEVPAEQIVLERVCADIIVQAGLTNAPGVAAMLAYQFRRSEVRHNLSLLREIRVAGTRSEARLAALALAYMVDHHLEVRLTETLVADALSVSRSHLSRVLNRTTGASFRWHLTACRLATATRLLSGATLSIKEISYRSGFSSVSDFDRQFRLRYRMTPSAYRWKGTD